MAGVPVRYYYRIKVGYIYPTFTIKNHQNVPYIYHKESPTCRVDIPYIEPSWDNPAEK